MLMCVLDPYVDIAVACIMIRRHVATQSITCLLPSHTHTHYKKKKKLYLLFEVRCRNEMRIVTFLEIHGFVDVD
jgi:hypothetical protein